MAPDLLEMGVNPAVFEISGHLLLKRSQDWQVMDEDTAVRLLAAASVGPQRFAALTASCLATA